MHQNLEKFDQFDVHLYAISKDRPNELKVLSDALKKEFPRNDDREITFISDPNFELIEYMDMRNEEVAYRGYGILNTNGEKVFAEINNYWGEELDQTIERIKEEYNKMNK